MNWHLRYSTVCLAYTNATSWLSKVFLSHFARLPYRPLFKLRTCSYTALQPQYKFRRDSASFSIRRSLEFDHFASQTDFRFQSEIQYSTRKPLWRLVKRCQSLALLLLHSSLDFLLYFSLLYSFSPRCALFRSSRFRRPSSISLRSWRLYKRATETILVEQTDKQVSRFFRTCRINYLSLNWLLISLTDQSKCYDPTFPDANRQCVAVGNEFACGVQSWSSRFLGSSLALPNDSNWALSIRLIDAPCDSNNDCDGGQCVYTFSTDLTTWWVSFLCPNALLKGLIVWQSSHVCRYSYGGPGDYPGPGRTCLGKLSNGEFLCFVASKCRGLVRLTNALFCDSAY